MYSRNGVGTDAWTGTDTSRSSKERIIWKSTESMEREEDGAYSIIKRLPPFLPATST